MNLSTAPSLRPARSIFWQIRSYLALGVALLTVLGYVLWSGYRQAVLLAEVTTRNLVQVIESRVGSDFFRIEDILAHLASEYRPQALGQLPAAERAEHAHRLVQLTGNFPALGGLFIFDADGELQLASNPDVKPFNIADRAHFRALRDDPRARFVFSDALVTRSTGKWAIVYSHAIRDAAGGFLGITNATFHLDGFAELFGSIDIGQGGLVLLRRSDTFKLIQRTPRLAETDFNQPIPPDNPVRQRIAAGDTAGTMSITASTDGVRRLVSFRRLAAYPFYVQVAMAESHYLAAWRRQALLAGGIAAVFAVFIGFAARHSIRTKAQTAAAQRELAAAEEKFRTVADFTLGWEYWEGPAHELLYMSPSCQAMTGYDRDAFLADPALLQRIVHPEDRAQFDLHVHDAGRQQCGMLEYRIIRRDGSIGWIMHDCRPVLSGTGQYRGRRISNRDITDRKQAEADLLRSNAELEQFSYSISHDMRQPLRMISSYLQLLQMSLGGTLDDEQREYFGFAVDGAQRLDAMLVGLLEYSRVGRKGEPTAWLESRAVLDDALLFLQPLASEAQAVLHIDGAWPRLLASPDEFLRLLQNLIGNALKFRVAGRTPEITLSGTVDAGRWRLCVADNGVGLLPEQAGRLFQVFQRLQSRADYEGNGIGLALCRKIVEHHGGRIWAESAGENQGSRFCFEIPLGEETATAAPPLPEASA